MDEEAGAASEETTTRHRERGTLGRQAQLAKHRARQKKYREAHRLPQRTEEEKIVSTRRRKTANKKSERLRMPSPKRTEAKVFAAAARAQDRKRRREVNDELVIASTTVDDAERTSEAVLMPAPVVFGSLTHFAFAHHCVLVLYDGCLAYSQSSYF